MDQAQRSGLQDQYGKSNFIIYIPNYIIVRQKVPAGFQLHNTSVYKARLVEMELKIACKFVI